MSSTPLASLERLFFNLMWGEPLSSEDRGRLAHALEDFFHTPDASLDKILGVKRRGGISRARADTINRRDQLIVRLWRNHGEYRGLPPIVAAKLMDLAASRYEADRWPRERHALAAPQSEPAATWWRVLRLGAGIPKQKRLQQILQREIQ